MKQRIEAWVAHQWYHKSTWIHALAPLSWLYRFWTSAGFIPASSTTKIPIWIIGNLTVGGVGKTPLVIEFIKRAQAYKLNVLVVVKPYRVPKLKHSTMLPQNADPSQYGDEAVLIQKKTHADVLCIAKDRRDLYQYMHQYDMVICDDGLQNKHLERSFNWVVMDQIRAYGNGYLLPHGPLRSSPGRWLKHIDQTMVKVHGDDHQVPYGFKLVIDGLKHLTTNQMASISDFQGKKTLLICGIGYPDQFFKQLAQMGIQGDQVVMKDHHAYSDNDCAAFKDYDAVIMTEKDGVKCKQFGLANVFVTQTSTKLSDQLAVRCDALLNEAMKRAILI